MIESNSKPTAGIPGDLLDELVRRPRGKIPSCTKEWLAVNEPDCGWEIAVCKCGGWYHEMDRLAPYHTELNWCPTCGHRQNLDGAQPNAPSDRMADSSDGGPK